MSLPLCFQLATGDEQGRSQSEKRGSNDRSDGRILKEYLAAPDAATSRAAVAIPPDDQGARESRSGCSLANVGWPDADHDLGNGQHGPGFHGQGNRNWSPDDHWNRTPGRFTAFVAGGAIEADTATAAASGADAVLVVLADDEAVLDVCLGDDGVLASLEPDAVFADVSTVSPETARRLAELGPEGRVLDAPVMGSPAMIAGGLGRFLIGGPASAMSAVEPLWTDLGSGYTNCGPVGSGATMKILANSLLITGVASLAEAIATARQQGIPDEFLRTLLADSPVLSLASNLRLDSLLDSTPSSLVLSDAGP